MSRIFWLACFAQIPSYIKAARFGVNIDNTQTSNPISAEEALNLVSDVPDYLDLQSVVGNIRLQGFDSSVTGLINACLADEAITSIYLTVPNSFLADFETSALPDLVSTIERIQQQRSDIQIAVSVGDEPYMQGFSASSVNNAIEVLKSNTVGVDVTVSLNFQIMNVSFPVEQGTFDDAFVAEYRSTLDLVNFFSISVDPFFTLDGNEAITIELTAGAEMGMLTQQIQALQAAFGTINYEKPITVSATRWPSSGNSFASPETNFQYISNVAKFAEDEASSGALFDTLYYFELYDQDGRLDEFQRTLGIFDTSLQQKVSSPTNGPTPFPTVTAPSPNPTTSPSRFPTTSPTKSPSVSPTRFPALPDTTPSPTSVATKAPTNSNSEPDSPVTPPPSSIPVNGTIEDSGDTDNDESMNFGALAGLVSLGLVGFLAICAVGLTVNLIIAKVRRDEREKFLEVITQESVKVNSPNFLDDGFSSGKGSLASNRRTFLDSPSDTVSENAPFTPRRAFIASRTDIVRSFQPSDEFPDIYSNQFARPSL